ncbi:MAG: hypothetical protein B7733_20350 [Myxococcales bacterium FL481]|nr:MAG: hypothetical protein B7733_20350 [Myxococcales bacterium FL481]
MSITLASSGLTADLPYASHRLELVARAICELFGADAFPELLADLAEYLGRPVAPLTPAERSRCDFPGMLAMLGWFHPARIEQLIHREWLDATTNEFDDHLGALRSLSAVERAETIEIVGAGTCRIGAHLASRDHVRRVRCGDLSPIALAAGRALIRGETSSLPKRLRRPRSLISVDAGTRLRQDSVASRYIPAGPQLAPIEFVVHDAFAALRCECEVMLLHYVLDAPSRFDTMLIRSAARLRPGQRLAVVTAISDGTRNPCHIVETVARCGFTVDSVAIKRLPYSLSCHDFTYERTVSNTLLLEATKRGEGDDDLAVFPTHRIADMMASASALLTPGQRNFPFEATDRLARALRGAFRGQRWAEFSSRLTDALGRDLSDTVTAYLCAREFMVLTYLPDSYRTQNAPR